MSEFFKYIYILFIVNHTLALTKCQIWKKKFLTLNKRKCLYHSNGIYDNEKKKRKHAHGKKENDFVDMNTRSMTMTPAQVC